MKITRTRTHKFSMAQYEQLELSATVEIDTDTCNFPEEDAAAFVNEMLDQVLQADLDRADQTSTTPEDSTYVHAWKDSL